MRQASVCVITDHIKVLSFVLWCSVSCFVHNVLRCVTLCGTAAVFCVTMWCVIMCVTAAVLCIEAAVFCVMTWCMLELLRSVSWRNVLQCVVQLPYCHNVFVSQCVVMCVTTTALSWCAYIMTWCVTMCVMTVALSQCVLYHDTLRHDVCYNGIVFSPSGLCHETMCCNPMYLLHCLFVSTVALLLCHICQKVLYTTKC